MLLSEPWSRVPACRSVCQKQKQAPVSSTVAEGPLALTSQGRTTTGFRWLRPLYDDTDELFERLLHLMVFARGRMTQ
jgi:hypothetical protein